MNFVKSKGFLLGVMVFLLVSIPLTTYLVITAEDTTKNPQASTLCQTDCAETAKTTTGTTREDINSDGKVDAKDLAIVVNATSNNVPATMSADLNKDGKVDKTDVSLVVSKMEK